MKDINSRIDRDKGVIYLTEKERTAQLIKPILQGRDIKRYSYKWAEWIINVHNGYTIDNSSLATSCHSERSEESINDSKRDISASPQYDNTHTEKQTKIKIPPIDINEYPALKAYFDKIAKNAKRGKGKGFYDRDDKGITPYNLRNCAYLPEFAKPKIVYSEIVREPQFYLDNGEFKFGHFYAEATSFILTANCHSELSQESEESHHIQPNRDISASPQYDNTCKQNKMQVSLEYLLGILHSKLCTFAFKEFYAGGGLGESGYRYKKAFLEKLPIPKITQKQEKEFVRIVEQIIESKAKNAPDNTLESRLDSMVYALYGLDSKEIEIIGGGGTKLGFALLLVSAIHSKLLDVVKLLCENFEAELKEAFRFCEGLKIPNTEKQAKIIYPNMAKEFIAYLDTQGFFSNQKCFILTDNVKDKDRLLYLTAILNSKTNFWYFKQIGATLGASGYEMSKIFVEKLPVVETNKIDSKLLREIENLASEILEMNNSCHSEACLQAEESRHAKSKRDVSASPQHDKTIHKRDTKALESRLDSLIYQAYNLTPDEIALIESELSTREREQK